MQRISAFSLPHYQDASLDNNSALSRATARITPLPPRRDFPFPILSPLWRILHALYYTAGVVTEATEGGIEKCGVFSTSYASELKEGQKTA